LRDIEQLLDEMFNLDFCKYRSRKRTKALPLYG